jgi:hypothetical protein
MRSPEEESADEEKTRVFGPEERAYLAIGVLGGLFSVYQTATQSDVWNVLAIGFLTGAGVAFAYWSIRISHRRRELTRRSDSTPRLQLARGWWIPLAVLSGFAYRSLPRAGVTFLMGFLTAFMLGTVVGLGRFRITGAGR